MVCCNLDGARKQVWNMYIGYNQPSFFATMKLIIAVHHEKSTWSMSRSADKNRNRKTLNVRDELRLFIGRAVRSILSASQDNSGPDYASNYHMFTGRHAPSLREGRGKHSDCPDP
ncbi:hypothetical protein HYDPIDRAFT_108009 [Hydnomerulius pinastri MD-312]|nr:hypothetical protein HYDPIDRAFT_108009 [Hydnomerulius pinastri MD-312]